MKRVTIIDSHTGGEPTRVVIAGGPALGRGDMATRLARFRDRHDRYRSAIVNEPRGSDVLVGALLCKPHDPNCAAGVIFFNNVGYLGMCGHGMIGVIVTLAHLRRIRPGEHRIETPAGVVAATLHRDGSVSVANVPSYRKAAGVTLTVPGLGEVRGDVAYGGNWFFLTKHRASELLLKNTEALTDRAWRIRQAVNANGFPEVDHVELIAALKKSGANSRNFVLCPGKAYDRSPCGTGTSAKLACLAADGKLAESEEHVVESITGSHFVGTYQWLDRTKGIIRPTITGTAHVNAEATLLLDERDPLCWGIGGTVARVSNPPVAPKSIPLAANTCVYETAATFDESEVLREGKDDFVSSASFVLRDGLPRSKREQVRKLVREKQQSHAQEVPADEQAAGFKGWRTRGYLPHFDRKEIVQFVTFRLADALPKERRREWLDILAVKDERKRAVELDAYLDKGRGACHLRRPEIADIVQEALLNFDGERYRLFAWCVMPNHVHVLLQTIAQPLSKILHSWKAWTSLQANRILKRSEPFWQREYFDRFIRDENHFQRAVRYIEANPVKAGLVKAPEDWKWSSARFAESLAAQRGEAQPAKRLNELLEREDKK